MMLRGVLEVKTVALGSHFVHCFSLQEFQWGQVNIVTGTSVI